jgi:putative hydrolase of the HAD superfamily
MKPHPSIFAAALQLVSVEPHDAVMVGDSVRQDVEGALKAGMQAILLHRGDGPSPPRAMELQVPIIQSLRELPAMIGDAPSAE